MRATKYSVHIIQRVSIRFGGMIGKWTFKNWLNTSYFEGLVMASDGWKKTSSWGQSRDLDDSQQRETSSLRVSAAQLEANNTDVIHSANLRVRQENRSKLPAIIKGGICFRLLKRNSSTWDTNVYSQEKCHIYLEVLSRTGSVSAYSHPWPWFQGIWHTVLSSMALHVRAHITYMHEGETIYTQKNKGKCSF